MIDLHYDLLSILYQCYLRMDYSYIDMIKDNFRKDNVSGLISNLYFMSQEEMDEELGENYEEINVVNMFKKSVDLFYKYFSNTEVVFSIEGCDYIKDINELEELYNLGLRNILLVWNCPNKYGSGNRGDYGLTEEGKEFITKAIDLGISIDFSHMNKKTFYDTYELCKDKINSGKKVKVIASHSNSFNVCPHMRNLDDDQLRCLKELDAVVGVVSYSKFVLGVDNTKEELEDKYLEHIKHIEDIMGIDNIAFSSDDMEFSKYFFNEDFGPNTFNYKYIKEEVFNLLEKNYDKKDIDKILYKNIKKKLF